MGVLMMIVLLILIAVGLQRNHHRWPYQHGHLAGSQNAEDRDLDRLIAELRARS